VDGLDEEVVGVALAPMRLGGFPDVHGTLHITISSATVRENS
jgi:hypothetical protein